MTQNSSAWDLLLAASSAQPDDSRLARIRSLLAAPPDWGLLLRLADHHGASSLLYQNVARFEGSVPAPTLAELHQRYERNIHKSLFLTRELIRILDCVQRRGIEVIPYKGVTLSDVFYGDLALRQSGDIDLFVRKRDLPRITAAIRELGYVPHTNLSRAAQRAYIESGYESTFDSTAGRNLIELQWHLQPKFYAVDYDMDGLFRRAVTASIAERAVRTPSPEDLLLVLAVHAAKHLWGRLIWTCDIAQVLQRQELNWGWMAERAREFGIERILYVTLGLSHQLLESTIPESIEKQMKKDAKLPGLLQSIAGAMASGISPNVESVSYFRSVIGLRERRVDRMRFLLRLIFTPGPGEWEAVSLPTALFPLYRVVRLGRLAARAIGR